MIIRQYNSDDCSEISHLFYETVHSVNKKDYSSKQLFAWASSPDVLQLRNADFLKQRTVVAETDGKIVGFASIDNTGCLDMLFVSKDYQRQGIAAALCDELERNFSVVTTYASITARRFFEKRGYIVTNSQTVERSGVKLINYKMQKIFNSDN